LVLGSDSLDAKIAYARLRIAKSDRVVAELQAIFFRSPKDHVGYYTFAQAYEARGALRSAVEEYKKAFEL
jgi:predicted Zn-dependent protease